MKEFPSYYFNGLTLLHVFSLLHSFSLPCDVSHPYGLFLLYSVSSTVSLRYLYGVSLKYSFAKPKLDPSLSGRIFANIYENQYLADI